MAAAAAAAAANATVCEFQWNSHQDLDGLKCYLLEHFSVVNSL
jgi:hypothetical protein